MNRAPFIALTLALGACSAETHEPPRNVLLLTLDTTRADALGCYGASGVKTPVLDRLADEGTRFENAISPSPVTLPSHATILTGSSPLTHGARDNGFYILNDENETLAEVLSGAGFQTAAVIAAAVLDDRFGLAQGFDVYDDDLSRGRTTESFSFVERTADQVVDAGLAWLDDRTVEQPFFLWLHFYDPHATYSPPTEWAQRVSDPYLAEIAFMDDQIGRVIERLEAENELERTLVVAVADHGEGRSSPHDEETHGMYLYEEVTRVPLLMRHESVPAGRVVSQLTGTIDIAPTICELLDIRPPSGSQGTSAVTLFRDENSKVNADRVLYLETIHPYHAFGWSSLCALRTPDWKYVDAPDSELYRLKSDPTESKNLLSVERDRARELQEILDRRRQDLKRGALQGAAHADAETRKLLSQLGYVQGGAGRDSVGFDPIEIAISLDRDPKERMGMLATLQTAAQLRSDGRTAEAIQVFMNLVARDERNQTALAELATIALETGDWASARKWYSKVLALEPTHVSALFGYGFATGELAAGVSVEKGQELRVEAEKFYRATLEADPEHGGALVQMGNLLLGQGFLRDAEEMYRKATEAEPFNATPQKNLGVLYSRAGHPKESAAAFERATQLAPRDADCVIGWVLALTDAGEPERARDIARDALVKFPGNPRLRGLAEK